MAAGAVPTAVAVVAAAAPMAAASMVSSTMMSATTVMPASATTATPDEDAGIGRRFHMVADISDRRRACRRHLSKCHERDCQQGREAFAPRCFRCHAYISISRKDQPSPSVIRLVL
jgi:hypothetical protein